MKCACENCEINNMFYSYIKDEGLEKFCVSRKEIPVPAGNEFVVQGSEIRHFKYLKEGLVKIHRTDHNNREQIIYFGKPMDFISIQNIFSEKTYNYSVTALEDSVVCVFEIGVINELISSNGDFAMKMIEMSNRAISKILLNSLELISMSMYGKVASVLLYFHDHIYKASEFELPVSRKEIGQYTGLSIETVIRVISEFRKDGILKVYGKKTEILDRDKLVSVVDHS